ncbi:hypothetical protein ASF43_07190 [Pseudorhodoferax sp. Leaf267]|nr:hypothetical protein ASF43_07190 [Pseudorhodoferax sp. Leaf267]
MNVHIWGLANHVRGLLLVAMLSSFALACGALVLHRIPLIEQQDRAALQREVDAMGERLALQQQAVQGRVGQLARLLARVPAEAADGWLDARVDDDALLLALYHLGPDDRVQALGLPPALRAGRDAWRGRDLARSPLLQALAAGAGLAWDGRHPSPITGEPRVALALRDAQGGVLVAEMQAGALVRGAALAGGTDASPAWVVDPAGELLVDTRPGAAPPPRDLSAWRAAARAAQRGAAPSLRMDGQRWQAAMAESATLGWTIVGRVPAGLDNLQVRRLVVYNGLALLASLLAGLALASWWAWRMARPLHDTVARARRAMAGDLPLPAARRSSVVEFNQLAHALETMALALHARELQWKSIFHAAPLAMGLSYTRQGMRLLDVNEAWCREYGFTAEQAIGRSPVQLGMFAQPPTPEAMDRVIAAGPTRTRLRLRRRDGQELQVVMFGPHPVPGAEREVIWASMDIGPLRQAEQTVRDLNQQLEQRVAQRTEALAASNAALARTAEQLHRAQDELVRAEKMAGLGALVAGIAHELHTPLGNGLLAVGSLAGVLERFAQATAAGLRRADLQDLLAGLEQGTEIAVRSLRRAADLVQNFKQVAVDQTSAQRRRFELHDLVRDMAASLRPGLAGTPYTIEVDVPATGLQLDSYPGALGQALGQLVHNAVQHGFDGRDHGCVRITGGPGAPGQVWLRVADDGRGIAAGRLARIFEPFIGGAPGRNGTGLGLYASANAVATLLGGSLTADSTEGQGSCFELRLPTEAPHAEPPT